MSLPRREFLGMAAVASLATGVRRGRVPPLAVPRDRYPLAGDPLIKPLALQALDAAKAAGATYADVRFTRTRDHRVEARDVPNYAFRIYDNEGLMVGIRAFVNGAWGFAGGPIWTPDEMARLGRMAAGDARVHAEYRRERIDLGDRPPVVTGDWTTPVQIDPCAVPTVEQLDVLGGLWDASLRLFPKNSAVSGWVEVSFRRQEKTFASTDGTFLMQTLYWAHPYMTLDAEPPKRPWTSRTVDILQPCAKGWELMMDPTLVPALAAVAEEALLQLEAERVTPGRYDIVCDAYTVGQLLGRTVGVATELDRALGYEANAGGTSFLAPPADILGRYDFGTPLLNVQADRSRPGALATVQWDDDGIAPDRYPLVRDGVVVDYHTTRELLPALAAWYGTHGRSLRSHGCAFAEDAGNSTLLQPPNLEMAPSAQDASFDELVAGLESGLVIVAGTAEQPGPREADTKTPVTLDRQRLNGEIDPVFAYEVKKGKRTRVLYGVECLFRTPELWKSLQAIGGASSQRTTGCYLAKGQPEQLLRFSVTAGPARFKQVAVTDRWRKA